MRKELSYAKVNMKLKDGDTVTIELEQASKGRYIVKERMGVDILSRKVYKTRRGASNRYLRIGMQHRHNGAEVITAYATRDLRT